MGIGIFGPALDANGNSIAGFKILELLSAQEGWSIFNSEPSCYTSRIFCIKPSILLATDPLTKTVLKVSLYYAYLLPNLNSIVQPSAICGGVKDETNISNGKTACS